MLSTTALVLALLVGGEDSKPDMTTTPAEAQEFVNLMVGRWSGEVTLVADAPALKKKKGDKVVTFVTRVKILDGKGFQTTGTTGADAGTDIGVYDPASKQFKVVGANTDGRFFQAIVWKEAEGKWKAKASGSTPEGTKTSVAAQFQFSEDGRTMTLVLEVEAKGTPPVRIESESTKLSK